MATTLTVSTDGVTNIGTSSMKAHGSWYVDESCCSSPCCTFSERFYTGTSNPPGTLQSAGSFCSSNGPDCDAQSYSLTFACSADTTYYIMANVVGSGCGGGTCGASKNGSVVSQKSNAVDAIINTPVVSAITTTTASVSVGFNPETHESTAQLIIEYKIHTDPGYTTAATYSGLSGTALLTKTANLTGLAPSTNYDVRARYTRTTNNTTSGTSTVANFTTLASTVTEDNLDQLDGLQDAVGVQIVGFAEEGDEETGTGVEEDIELSLVASHDEQLVGVWFFHIPTRSYWFWSLDGLTAITSDTNSDDQNRTWAALGADVYYLDDDTYPHDDHDQTHPLDISGGFEIPLSIAPKAIDGKGRYIAAQAVDVKWGSSDNVDPYGQVHIDQLSDIYVGPTARKLLGTQAVDVAPQGAGYDEWRSYSLSRVQPSNVIGLRFGFSQGDQPHRVQSFELETVRIIVGKSPLRKRRS